MYYSPEKRVSCRLTCERLGALLCKGAILTWQAWKAVRFSGLLAVPEIDAQLQIQKAVGELEVALGPCTGATPLWQSPACRL